MTSSTDQVLHHQACQTSRFGTPRYTKSCSMSHRGSSISKSNQARRDRCPASAEPHSAAPRRDNSNGISRDVTRFIYLLVIISSCLLPSSLAQHPGTDDKVETVHVQGDVHVDSSLTPPNIQLNFTLNGKLVTFYLTRNDYISPNAPVMTTGNNGVLVHIPTEHPLGVAYYYDTDKSASFRLTVIINDDLTFGVQCSGTFQYENVQHTIEPATTASNSDGSGRRRRRRWAKRSVSDLSDDSHYIYSAPSTDDAECGPSIDTPAGSLPPPLHLDESSIPNVGPAYYTVELLAGIDYRLYQRWYDLSSGSTPQERETNTINELRYYFAHVINGVDTRYKTINDPNFRIRVRLVGFYIAKTPAGSRFMEDNRSGSGTRAYISSQNAIYGLYNFALSNDNVLPPHDQFTIFTGDNMNGNTGNRISGLSFFESICSHYSLSLVKDSGLFGTTNTAAHELGHNLGALHDGDHNTCSGRDNYIMAAGPSTITDAVVKNVFLFSPCSQQEMSDYFTQRGLSGMTCLLTDQSQLVPSNAKDLLPGQWYTPDQQCQIIYGSGSFYCSGRSLDPQMCRNMQCYNPEWNYCVSTYTQMAFTGTSCGNKKWCTQGNCVYNTSAPTFPDVCQYGDFKGAILNGMTCKAVAAAKWNCYEDYVADSCCSTCLSAKDDSKPDCLYGDREANCDTRSLDCNDADVKRRCCGTCNKRSQTSQCEASWCSISSGYQCYSLGGTCCDSCALYKTSKPGCEYGDKADTCKSIQPYECYTMSSTCCQSCAKYQTSIANCQYGDKVSYCTNIDPGMCYLRAADCCGSCQRYATGIQGCEYGDKESTCSLSDCENPVRKTLCCKTCYGYTTTTTSTTIARTTTKSVATSTMPGKESCFDQATWCSTISPSACYDSVQYCCATCSSMFIDNAPGCEYGDRYVWCAPQHCSESESTKRSCCKTCGILDGLLSANRSSTVPTTTTTKATTTTTTTTTTTPTTTTTTLRTTTTSPTTTRRTSPTTFFATTKKSVVDPTCVDTQEISWCKDMDSMLCYNPKLNSMCCASCRLKFTGIPNCDYGDKITGCVNIKKEQCNYYREDCCNICKDV